MCVWVALGDEQFIRRLVLVDVIGEIDLLLHAIAGLGHVLVLPNATTFRRGVDGSELERCKVHEDKVACTVFVEL